MAKESVHHISKVEVQSTEIPWDMVGQICPSMFRHQVKFQVDFELNPDKTGHVSAYDDEKILTVRKRVAKFLREHCEHLWSLCEESSDDDYEFYTNSNDSIWIVFESKEEKTLFVKNCLMKLKLTNADYKDMEKANSYY